MEKALVATDGGARAAGSGRLGCMAHTAWRPAAQPPRSCRPQRRSRGLASMLCCWDRSNGCLRAALLCVPGVGWVASAGGERKQHKQCAVPQKLAGAVGVPRERSAHTSQWFCECFGSILCRLQAHMLQKECRRHFGKLPTGRIELIHHSTASSRHSRSRYCSADFN